MDACFPVECMGGSEAKMEKAFAYICAAQEAAPRLLRRYCHKVYELGYVPICPRLSLPQYLSEDVPEEQRAMSQISQQLLRRCRMLVVCGNEISTATVSYTHLDVYKRQGLITAVNAIDNAEHLPLGVNVRKGAVDRAALNEWWMGRAIPVSRAGLRHALEELNIATPQKLLEKCLGLSLSDQYWILSLIHI